jgi:hypothetical protein
MRHNDKIVSFITRRKIICAGLSIPTYDRVKPHNQSLITRIVKDSDGVFIDVETKRGM